MLNSTIHTFNHIWYIDIGILSICHSGIFIEMVVSNRHTFSPRSRSIIQVFLCKN